MLKRMEIAVEFSRSELYISLSRMVVVRDHDFVMWVAGEPHLTIAFMGILIQTTKLMYIFLSSLSFSMSTRVGNKLGAGRPGNPKMECDTKSNPSRRSQFSFDSRVLILLH
ncbi:hypothetical protein L2E82_20368 [Cichorium intybus]|uniref:Uncharacterized protein n=1 Tax=Cichorium intybus TaxID=13427 RepID=A0ACB9DT59_CICIN|nr:hypothetical protein L2E82_20368 [Cichorium intybus]